MTSEPGLPARGLCPPGFSSRRPRIAITCGYEQAGVLVTRAGLDYTDGVEEAGGLPLIIPVPYRVREGETGGAAAFAEAMAAEILGAVDGVLVTGGGDVDPEYFGEAPIPSLGTIEPARDVLEMAIVRAALSRRIPLLGICRGIQLLAIAAGGGLYQDLATQKKDVLKHRQTPSPRHALTHFVDVRPGTLLAGLVGEGSLKVNSFHHQAVSRVPAGFRVSATAPDGVVEAIERAGTGGATGTAGGAAGAAGATAGSASATDATGAAGPAANQGEFALGVQWHPENLWSRNPVFLGIFKGLVDAAGHRRGNER